MGNLSLNTAEGSPKTDQPKISLHHTAAEEENQMELTDIKSPPSVLRDTENGDML